MPRGYKCLLYVREVYGVSRREVASRDLVGPGAKADSNVLLVGRNSSLLDI